MYYFSRFYPKNTSRPFLKAATDITFRFLLNETWEFSFLNGTLHLFSKNGSFYVAWKTVSFYAIKQTVDTTRVLSFLTVCIQKNAEVNHFIP